MAVNVSAWVWTLELQPYDKMVMLELADHCDTKGFCFPKQGTIAKRTGIHRGSVNRIIKRLEAMGLLVQTRRFEGGYQRASEYRLALGTVIYLSNAVLPCNVTESDSTESQSVTPIETSVESSGETSLADEPQESSLNIQDVIKKNSKSKDEIFPNYKPTPKGCGDLWRDCRAAAGEHGYQAELTNAHWKMLNQARIRLGDVDYPALMWKVMHNWDSFCKHAESHAGAFNSPLVPQVAYFVKFIEAAADYAVPVTLIAKPLTNKPAPCKPIPKVKKDKEPAITLQELLAMNKDDE